MRRELKTQESSEKVRSIRVRTEDVYGGMIAKRMQEDSGLTRLAGSIARYGLLQPVLVRRNPATGRYALICGARRLAACRMLGVREINAMLIEADEDEALVCFLHEHSLHRATHFLSEAQLIVGNEALAEQMPDGGARLKKALELYRLEQPVKDVIARNGLTLEQAQPLLGIHQRHRQLEAAMLIADRALTPAQARRLVYGPNPGGNMQDGARVGRRRMMRTAMEETSRMAERLRAQGLEATMTVHAQECGISIQMRIQNGKK